MRSRLVLGVLMGACGAAWGAPSACVTVARCAVSPVIDGSLGDPAWEAAAGLSSFAAVGGATVALPETVCLLTYDDECLYVAVRCAETDSEHLVSPARTHDDEVWADDSVQVVVAPEDLRKAGDASIRFGGYAGAYNTWYQDIQAYYEFTVNSVGSTSEARNDVRDFDAAWRSAVGREPGTWTVEMAIPFTSVGVERAPEGSLLGLNVFRNRPPQLSGWLCPGFGGYTPMPLGAMLLAGARPVARLSPGAPPALGDNVLALALDNPTTAPVAVQATVTPSGGAAAREALTLAPGESRSLSLTYRLAGQGGLAAAYDVRLEGADTPLLAGTLPLSVPASESADLRYYGLPGLVEACVQLGPASAAAKAVLSLTPQDGAAATTEETLTGTRGARLRLDVGGQPGDSAQAVLQVISSDGTVLLTRSRDITLAAKPAFLGTRAGLPTGVLPPWTPVAVHGRAVEVLGRTLTYDTLALPSAVRSADAELLAAPMALAVRSGGREPRWRARDCRLTEQAEDHARWESLWTSRDLDLRVVSTVDYDGFTWNEVTLLPHRPVAVDSLNLVIPLRTEVARYVYEGHAQAAHALSPVGLRRPLGDNLWIGDDRRGLAFEAESLEWVLARQRERQVEVTREGDTTTWTMRFIDTPTTISEPYTASFALTPTPTKPVSPRHARIYHGAYYGMEEPGASGSVQVPLAAQPSLAAGTLECWVRPTFDTAEVYDPAREQSSYNRAFLSLSTDRGQSVILYYNSDDRSFRLLVSDGAGGYRVAMGSPQRLPADAWSYVAISWGRAVRLSVNGTVVETQQVGLAEGALSSSGLSIDLSWFDLDELRISESQRAVDRVPVGPLGRYADTLLLDDCEDATGRPMCRTVPGHVGNGLGAVVASRVEQLAAQGQRIVIFHENWSPYQGYPDLRQVERLKRIADASHANGMLFLVYFCQLMSDAAPEWPTLRDDLTALPDRVWYHRDDVKQDCTVACVNGPYGDLLLDGIEKLADQAGIDGVYMDGTSVPWDCANPTHPGCGVYAGDGVYLPHNTIRGTRTFLRRLRSIFAERGRPLFLDAHTGGQIRASTLSLCDGYYDGEHLARYKPGFRLSPDAFATAYVGKQFGVRGEFLPCRHTMDQALAIALIHDTSVRGQPTEVDRALGPYEGADTRFIAYSDRERPWTLEPASVLASAYLRRERALVVLGSQTEEDTACTLDVRPLLRLLPPGSVARDALTGEAIPEETGRLRFPLVGRGWRMVEVMPPG